MSEPNPGVCDPTSSAVYCRETEDGKSDIVRAKVPCALVGMAAEAPNIMSYHMLRTADDGGP